MNLSATLSIASAAKATEEKIEEIQREIQRRKLAVGLLEGRVQRAKIAAQDSVKARLTPTP